jgi:glycerol uptake facilitator-like aquaporin
MTFTFHFRLAAEFLGTAFLLMAVVGSGIMGERLGSGNLVVALLDCGQLRSAPDSESSGTGK